MELNLRQELAPNYVTGHQRISNPDFRDLCPYVHAETICRDLADMVKKGILWRIGDKRATYYILKE